ncbi:MAG TPA: glycosyltransferase family 39 protein [Myxococcota bacterium]|nr:glycosyltransferase family 39 protein [Myxococcota bacterium]
MNQPTDHGGTIFRLSTRLAVLAAILLLWHGMDTGSLVPGDDAIYTRAAIEGAQAGRLLDVTWMGDVLFEKGPLLFSAIQLGGLFPGPVEQQARFPGVIAGVLLLLLIYRISRDLGLSAWAAYASAAFCLASSLFFFNARRPMTDVPGLLLALAGLRAFMISSTRRSTVVSGLLFGFSSLFKLTAPVPFMAAALVLKAIGVGRDARPDARSLSIDVALCGAGFLVAALPWHVAMTVVHGQAFLDTYFGFHLFSRLSQSVAGMDAGETYVGWLVRRDLPSLVFLLLTTPVVLMLAVRKRKAAVAALVLALLAAVPPAISSTALPHYLVPIIPGAALMVGVGVEALLGLFKEQATPRTVVIIAIFALLTGAFVFSNRQDLLKPDYSHDSRAMCDRMRMDGSAARIAGTFDLHDTSIPLYCDMKVEFWGHNPGYQNAMKDIPMLRGTYRPFETRLLRVLADTGEILVTDTYGLRALSGLANDQGLELVTKEFGDRFAVSFVRQ